MTKILGQELIYQEAFPSPFYTPLQDAQEPNSAKGAQALPREATLVSATKMFKVSLSVDKKSLP